MVIDRGKEFGDSSGVFAEGVSLGDLAKKLDVKDKGLGVVATAVLKTWHKMIAPKFNEQIATPIESFDFGTDREPSLSGEIVGLNDDLVIIHGVRHSNPGSGHKSKEFLNIVKSHVTRTSSRGEVWLTEQGLDRDFGISEKAEPIQDIKTYMESKIDVEEVKKRSFFGKLKAVGDLVKGELNDAVGLLDTVTYMQDPAINAAIKTEEDRMTEDPRHFLKGQRLEDFARLPQPLDMEIGMVNAAKGDLNKPNLVIDRSFEQAKLVKTKLEELHSKQEVHKPITVHLLCGDLHRPQVAHFLRNPDYDVRKSILKSGMKL